MEVAQRQNRPLAAVLLMLVAFFMFATVDTAAKWSVTHGMPVEQTVFLRYAAHALIMLAVFLPRHGLSLFASAAPGKEALRALFLVSATVCNYSALQYLPLSTAIAIFFATPLLVCAFSIPLLGETVGPRRWAAILVGFLGVLVVTRPLSEDFHWAMLLSIGAAISASLYFVMTRLLSGIDNGRTMLVYSSVLPLPFLLPLVPGVWEWPDASAWMVVGIMGCTGVIGHFTTVTALRFATASGLAPLVYSQIFFAIFYGYVLFGNRPDEPTLLGAAILVASGLYLWIRERRVARG